MPNSQPPTPDPLSDDFVVVGEYETYKVVDFARLPKKPVLKLA